MNLTTENLEPLSELMPLIMTIVSVLIVMIEWWYLSKMKLIHRHKEGVTNLYSAILTYLPIFMVNTGLTIALMFVIYEYRFLTLSFEWYTWILAYIAYDFMSYLIHFFSHKVRFLWCIHSVHHSPKEMKASVSFRGSFAEFLLAPHLILWLPLMGFHPFQILIIEAVGQLYGVPLHLNEKLFKRRSWLNYFLVTPSFHRLHHAKNDLYLDTNYALTFTLWDRIFRTFQREEETEAPKLGLTKELESDNLWISQTDEFQSLWRDIKSAPGILNKWKYLIKPPGWNHEDGGMTASMIRREILKHHKFDS